jgi:hypothetical protein
MIYAASVLNGKVISISEVSTAVCDDGTPQKITDYLSGMSIVLDVKKSPVPHGVQNTGSGITSYRFGAADMTHAAYIAEYILRNKDK